MPDVRIRLDHSVTPDDTAALWPVYDAVFADHPSFAAWRERVWDRHTVRGGFRLARAYRESELVGFAYGYIGEPGQWWTDNARRVLAPDVADAWLGGHFELVSLGVLESARRSGIGRELIRALLADLEPGRVLLMATADSTDPARRLYASAGWQVLGPGIGPGTVILGMRTGRAR
ncbi:GNAT family N-acetyltransferase [Paractinoplanes maris]|uniref:GNAT family N-acetyltransferase n=1 Tax=Paractinoplanes maris TaxID=1734446 RepID=UPI00202217F5|nr:GNAT family N-acetyltransferase [Actinoplanes maris]